MPPCAGAGDGATYDVIVIGGGINGSGIAREAALRGLSILLIEKDDFCAGTSGRTSKLIHGGLRYLEHRQWRLVRESLREREALLQAFPRLVRPLPFLRSLRTRYLNRESCKISKCLTWPLLARKSRERPWRGRLLSTTYASR